MESGAAETEAASVTANAPASKAMRMMTLKAAQKRAAQPLSAQCVKGKRRATAPDADLGLNYERVATKPAGEPDSQTVRFTIRQLW